MSIDDIRQRRLREIRLALAGTAKGASYAAPLVAYFDAPHHGSAVGLRHGDLNPGTHIILEGDPEQALGSDFSSYLRDVEIKTVWISDADAIDIANLTRDVGSPATLGLTTTDSIPEPPDMTMLFLFLSKEKRESFIGDLEERYGVMLQQEGRRAAAIWFWRDVVLSFLSLALDALKRVSGLEKLMRRIGS